MDKPIRPFKKENNKYTPKVKPLNDMYGFQNRHNFIQNVIGYSAQNEFVNENNQHFSNHNSNQLSHSNSSKFDNSQFAGMKISNQTHYNIEKPDFDHRTYHSFTKPESANINDTKLDATSCSDDRLNDDLISSVHIDLTNSYIYFGTVLSLNDKYGFIKAYREESVVETTKAQSKWSQGNKTTQGKKDNLYFQRNSVIGYIKELCVGDFVSYTITTDGNHYSSLNFDEDSSTNGYKKSYSSAHFCKKAENVALLGDICIERSIFPLLGKIIKLINEKSNDKAILKYQVNGQMEKLSFDYKDLSHIQKMEELNVGDKVFFNIVAYPFPGAQRTAYNVRQALEASNEVRQPATPELLRGYVTSSKESFGKITYLDERSQADESLTESEVFFHFEDTYIEPGLLKNPKFLKEAYFKQHLTVGTPVFFKIENRFGKEIAIQVTPLGTHAPIEGRIFTPYLSYSKPPPSTAYDTHLGSVYIEHLGMEVVIYKESLQKPAPSSLYHGDTVILTLERANASNELEAKGDTNDQVEPLSTSSNLKCSSDLIDFTAWSINVSSVQLCPEASFYHSQEPRYKAYTIRNFGCRDLIVTLDGSEGGQRYYVAPLKHGEIIKTSHQEESCSPGGNMIETFEVTLGRSCSDTVPFPTYLGAISFFTATRAIHSGHFTLPDRSADSLRRLLQVGYVVCYGDGGKSLTPAPGFSLYRFLLEQPTSTSPGRDFGIIYLSLEELFAKTESGPNQLSSVIDWYEQWIASRSANQEHSRASYSEENQSRGMAPPFFSDLKAAKRREASLKQTLSEVVSRALIDLWRQIASGRQDIKTSFLPYSSYRIQNFSTGNFILFHLLRPDEKPFDRCSGLPMLLDPISCQTTYKGYIIRNKGESSGKKHHYSPNSKEPDLVQTDDNCYTIPITNYLNIHPPMGQSSQEINLGDRVTFRIDAPNSFTTAATAHTVALDARPASSQLGNSVDDGQLATLKYFGVVVSVNTSANKYKVPFAGLIRILAVEGQLLPEHGSEPEVGFYFRDLKPRYKAIRGGEIIAFCDKVDICHQSSDDNQLLVMAETCSQNNSSACKKIDQKALALRLIEPEVGDYCFEGKITHVCENGNELTIAPTASSNGDTCTYSYQDRGGQGGRRTLKLGDSVYCWTPGPHLKTAAIFHVERRVVQSASKWACNKGVAPTQGPQTKYQGPSYEPCSQKHPKFNGGGCGPGGVSRFRNNSATAGNSNCDESSSLTGLVQEAFNVKLIRQPHQPMPDERGFSSHGHVRNIPLAPSKR